MILDLVQLTIQLLLDNAYLGILAAEKEPKFGNFRENLVEFCVPQCNVINETKKEKKFLSCKRVNNNKVVVILK